MSNDKEQSIEKAQYIEKISQSVRDWDIEELSYILEFIERKNLKRGSH